MSKFVFIGHDNRIYGHIVIPGEGTYVAKPGDVRDFDEPPTDGLWLPLTKNTKAPKANEK